MAGHFSVENWSNGFLPLYVLTIICFPLPSHPLHLAALSLVGTFSLHWGQKVVDCCRIQVQNLSIRYQSCLQLMRTHLDLDLTAIHEVLDGSQPALGDVWDWLTWSFQQVKSTTRLKLEWVQSNEDKVTNIVGLVEGQRHPLLWGFLPFLLLLLSK
jgi:hypothetical protein